VFGEVFHRVSTEALGGARLAAWGFSLFVGGGGGLNDETGTPDARVFASLGWNRRWGRDRADPAAEGSAGDGARAASDAHRDRDGDGYVDAVDRCPDQPEDRDGFEDDDGCPDVDNDGDGITDAFDQCPMEPEDRDGFADADGCPDEDNDGDGLADARDACPDDPEDPDGDRDDDGCPDVDGDFAIDVVVFFDTDQTEVPEESQYELDRLARTLVAAPPWVHAWVEGHADDTGSTVHNQELSSRRARAVLNYLVARGVDRERLSIVGFGEWYNVRPNESAGGKRANRRVEFRVAPRASVPKGPPPGLATPPDPASPPPPSGSEAGDAS
jgi:outer membrane protein OmpA-like peptidoglycan-associated protein